MNILIIEDEIKTAKALSLQIQAIEPGTVILATIQSIANAISFLKANPTLDLIFMDIQLADGLCFEIFKEVDISTPVIFCTAFDEYAIEAFKANGIDYILKPFSKESIQKAFEKTAQLKHFFRDPSIHLEKIEAFLSAMESPTAKKSFLVFKNNKYSSIETNHVAFFYIRNELSFIVTFDGQEYILNQSLDEIHKQVLNKQFFRLNRQYLINFSAIKEVEHYFARKLLVKLIIKWPDQLLIGKDRTTEFLTWFENR